MFQVTHHPIDRDLALGSLKNPRAGGLVVFEGWVRDHNEGKSVASLEYQIYKELALKEGEKILAEARTQFHIEQALCIHREGHLKLGDTAVLVATQAAHRDAAFTATRYIIDQIKLRLPIWKKEHYTQHEPVWVYCKDHATHVHFSEDDYYEKQVRIVEQTQLKNARVLVIGAGGLGCPALTALANAGIGHLTVVDHDFIDFSNLHRQPLYCPSLVGEKKALIAQKKLLELNPYIEVTAMTEFVDSSNLSQLIQGQNLVLDCTDSMATKLLIHDACFTLGISLITASVHQHQGQLRTFSPTSDQGCWRCSLEETPQDELIGNCNDFGVVAPTLTVMGGLQASEALNYLQNEKCASQSHTFYWNLKTLEHMKIRSPKNPQCGFCGKSDQKWVQSQDQSIEISARDLTGEFNLLDIRELEEDALTKILEKIIPEKNTAIFCHRGIRSLKLVKKLRTQGYERVFSVKGGAGALLSSGMSTPPAGK